MKVRDIIGVKTYSNPSTYFRGSGPPTPHDIRPC